MPWIAAIAAGAAATASTVAKVSASEAQKNAEREAFQAKQEELARQSKINAEARDQGRQDLQQGVAGARQDIQGGVAQAGQTLGGINTQYNAADVSGTRSRLGETLDQGFSMQADPGYQFRQQQGEQAILRQNAASGGRYGGAAMKEAARFNSGLAAQENQAAFNRYAASAGLAGQADAGARQLALDQAMRQDAANRFGIGGQMQLGQQMAGYQYGAGQQMGANQMQLGGGQAGLYGDYANRSMGLAGSSMNAWDQHAGMAGLTEATVGSEMAGHADRGMELYGSMQGQYGSGFGGGGVGGDPQN